MFGAVFVASKENRRPVFTASAPSWHGHGQWLPPAYLPFMLYLLFVVKLFFNKQVIRVLLDPSNGYTNT